MKFFISDDYPECFTEDLAFDPLAEGYVPLDEPEGLNNAVKKALPIMLALTLLTIGSAWALGLSLSGFIHNIFLSLVFFLLIFVPLHEFIHALFFPGGPFSSRVKLGLIKKPVAFFAAFAGDIPKKRYLLIFLAPFIILSPLVLVIIAAFNLSPLLESMMMTGALLNALGSCVDIMGMGLILSQVPANGLCRNKGYYTYYKTVYKTVYPLENSPEAD